MPIRNRRIAQEGLINQQYVNDRSLRVNLDMSPGANPLVSFNRYYSIYPQYEKETVLQWVFLTRPCLNIFNSRVTLPSPMGNYMDNISGYSNAAFLTEEAARNPIISYIAKTHGECLINLSEYSFSHHFIPYFIGKVESVPVPDFTIKVYTLSQPYTGYTLPIAGHGIESTTGGNVSVTYRDDQYYRILTTHRAWAEYMHGVSYGALNPKRAANAGPVESNWMDYPASMYMITTRPEGHEILWFAKWTGLFPTEIPESTFSFNRGSQPSGEISIPYTYFHFRACDPCILRDFNYNAFGGRAPRSVRIASSHDGTCSGNGEVGVPFIAVGTGSNAGRFYLEWESL